MNAAATVSISIIRFAMSSLLEFESRRHRPRRDGRPTTATLFDSTGRLDRKADATSSCPRRRDLSRGGAVS